MNSMPTFCSLCLVSNSKLINILLQDSDGVVIEEKLKVFYLELVYFKPYIVKYVCEGCLNTINFIYKFRVKCVENMTALTKYWQKYETQVSNENIIDEKTNHESKNIDESEREHFIQSNVIENLSYQNGPVTNKTNVNLLKKSNELKQPEEIFIKTEIEENIESTDHLSEENVKIKLEDRLLIENIELPYEDEQCNKVEHNEIFDSKITSTNTKNENLYVGLMFATYAELVERIKKYEAASKQKFYKKRSRTIKAATKIVRKPLNPSLEYYEIEYSCVHGQQRRRGIGLRNVHSKRLGCKASFKIRACSNGQFLEISYVNFQHTNHELLTVIKPLPVV